MQPYGRLNDGRKSCEVLFVYYSKKNMERKKEKKRKKKKGKEKKGKLKEK